MLDLEEWPYLRHMRPQSREKTQGPKSSCISNSSSNYRNTRVVSTDGIEGQLQSRPQDSERRKRHRALEDIEGDDTLCLQRKKRKLRHVLSTSRLSKPYAVPATYIPSRKTLREGIWARQRVAGRNLLRKAAALNSYAKKKRAYQNAAGRSQAQRKSPSVSPRLKPSRSASPSRQRSRSPLSTTSSTFSDFHIFDFEDEIGQEDECEWLGSSVINSDFSKLQEVEWDVIQEYGFDGSSNLELDDIYSFDPGGKGKAMGLILENERQSEVSLAPRLKGTRSEILVNDDTDPVRIV